MFEGALSFRDGLTRDVSSIPERSRPPGRLRRLAWDLVGARRGGAESGRHHGALPAARGRTMPVSDDESGLICIVSKSY